MARSFSFKITDKGVCVDGFRAGGVREGKHGLALLLSERGCSASLMLTRNRIRAAPLVVSAEHTRGKIRGVIANSGTANAFTGKAGIKDARETCSMGAKKLDLKAEEIIVASTGIIGRRLDMGRMETQIVEAAEQLEESPRGSQRAARAIMTTDTSPKSISVEVKLEDGSLVEIGGIAKGSGMIAPQLSHATMLCFLTTSAHIPPGKIDSILREAVAQSFDMVVVDGDTSTNDMVLLLSSGKAGNEDVDKAFQEGLNFVARELARAIAKDGEGSTKYMEVKVWGAGSSKDAKKAARAVVSSNLVKTAVFGGDPNWGRIVAALGYSGAELEQERLSLYLSDQAKEVCLVREGAAMALDGSSELEEAREILRGRDIYIRAELGLGTGEATAFGCDMGYEYIRINSEYTS